MTSSTLKIGRQRGLLGTPDLFNVWSKQDWTNTWLDRNHTARTPAQCTFAHKCMHGSLRKCFTDSHVIALARPDHVSPSKHFSFACTTAELHKSEEIAVNVDWFVAAKFACAAKSAITANVAWCVCIPGSSLANPGLFCYLSVHLVNVESASVPRRSRRFSRRMICWTCDVASSKLQPPKVG